MKRYEAAIDYPWCGIPSDTHEFEVEDDATEEEIEEIALEVIQEMIWNRVSTSWYPLDAEEDEEQRKCAIFFYLLYYTITIVFVGARSLDFAPIPNFPHPIWKFLLVV